MATFGATTNEGRPDRDAWAALPPPWAPAGPHDGCNFHKQRAAVVRYAGTPVCEQCARHLAGRGDDGSPAEREIPLGR